MDSLRYPYPADVKSSLELGKEVSKHDAITTLVKNMDLSFSAQPWVVEALEQRCSGTFSEGDLYLLRKSAERAKLRKTETLLIEDYPDPPRWLELLTLMELQALATVESLTLFENLAYTQESMAKTVGWLVETNGTVGLKADQLIGFLERVSGGLSPELKQRVLDKIDQSLEVWSNRESCNVKFEDDDSNPDYVYGYSTIFAKVRDHIRHLEEIKEKIRTL